MPTSESVLQAAAIEDAVGLWLARHTDWPPDSVHVRDDQPDDPTIVDVQINYDDGPGDLQRPGTIRLVSDGDAMTYMGGFVRVAVPELYESLGLDPDELRDCAHSDCTDPATEYVIFAKADRIQEYCDEDKPASVPLLYPW
jgi:hypothetical protein